MDINFTNTHEAHQGRHQHHQRGFGQVEICHQRIGNLKLVSRRNKNIGKRLKRLNNSTYRRTFNQSQRRGAHRNNPPACGLGFIDFSRRLGANLAPFGMHFMI